MEISVLYTHFLESTGICTDTRKINKGNLFFALKGPNFNGNQYAVAANLSGAMYAVIDEDIHNQDAQCILVDDALKTLQDLANYHLKQLRIPLIGIAGSNGKTTTKELLHAVLSKKYKTFATQGNLNNHIGVPLSILSMEKTIEIAILELGANHVGELELLCHIAEPSYGLITNNGMDHLEGYGSFEGVVAGNSELYYWLFKNNGIPFVNSKDGILTHMASRFKKLITYGSENDFFNSDLTNSSPFVKLITDQGLTVQTQLIGDYNLDNINAALCIGRYFDVTATDCADAIEAYIPANNRSQLVSKGTNTIILDCYNANPSSMQKSIESFSNLEATKKILMLGDMFELGTYSKTEHQNIINLTQNLKFDALFFCGNDFFENQIDFPNARFFQTRGGLEQHLVNYSIQNSTILLKGSRGMQMEKLVGVISE